MTAANFRTTIGDAIDDGLRPAPPYPADVRAKGWTFQVDVERVEQSDTWTLADDAIRPWLLMLWIKAWTQAPCGSLPVDGRLIARRLGMPMGLFEEHRAVLLRGWYEASDGRLYHRTITELVETMRDGRKRERDKKARQRASSKPAGRDEEGSPVGVPGDKMGTPRGVPPPDQDQDQDQDQDRDQHQLPGTRQAASRTDQGKVAPSVAPVVATRRSRKTEVRAEVEAPQWLPAQEWADFIEHRRAMKKVPFTDAAKAGVLRELAKLHSLGHDPAEMLTTAVVRGWRTVFPPAPGVAAGRTFVGKQSAIEAANKRAGAAWLAKQEAADADR